jgi:serine/threonine protein kinase
MSSLSATSLVDRLREGRLLSSTQDEELNELQARHPEARELASELLARGWLTPFQVNQLLQGRNLVLGSYVVVERIGEGGTGQVFKARHIHMKRLVALKVIRPELLADPEVVARFYREVEVASQVSHPNIVQAYDAGPAGGNHLLAMELVDGIDLEKLVREQGPLSAEQAGDYVRQAALGLQHIHECGLVHRDIKPSNLLVTRPAAGRTGTGGVIKVLDLGLARLLATNKDGSPAVSADGKTTMGTVDYMSPEQALDFHNVDIRSDIYSLGCSFYFLLTGRPPFAGGTLAEKLMRHQRSEPDPAEGFRADLPPGLPAVLKRTTAKDPAERYSTPGEVAQALASLWQTTPPLALPVASSAPADGPATVRVVKDLPPALPLRRRWLFPLGAAAILLLGAGTWLALATIRNPDAGKTAAQGSKATPSAAPSTSVKPGALTSFTITNRDGRGADAALNGNGEDRKKVSGNADRLGIKAIAHSRKKALVRFDLTALEGRKVTEAILVFTTASHQARGQQVNVFGLNDGDKAEEWDPGAITWENAPANVEEGGSHFNEKKKRGGGVDSQRTTFLGMLSLPNQAKPDGETITLTSPRLVEFLNRDTNKLVTFILTAVDVNNSQDVGLAGSRHATLPPPTLKLEAR